MTLSRRGMVFSFAVGTLCGSATLAPAQIGTGWRQDFPSKSIQLRGSGTKYTNVGGIETFTMTDSDERSEMRVQNDYTSGRKQFEGYLRASYGQGTSMHQVFKFVMVVYYPTLGGELRQHSYMPMVSGIQGVWVRVNTIHNVAAGKCDVYINGTLKATVNQGSGPWYHKYGVYNASTQGAKAEWRDVKFFTYTGQTSPTPTPTPTPTSAAATPTPTPTPTLGGSFIEITPPGAAVTASTNDGNLPANTVDNNLGTRWSASGDGQWIKYDLGTLRTVSHVAIAVHNGNSRQNRFDLQVSSDNVNWTNVITGGLTSGTTTAEEIHDFADASARWVRYLGHGATTSTFNSVAEVSVFAPQASTTPTPTATPEPTPTPTATPVTGPVEITPGAAGVTASTNDGNLPANVVDNSLATRWSANGDGQWLQLDLGATRTVSHVRLATYNGNTRRSRFDLQISTGGGVWSNVLTAAETSGTTTAEETFDFPDVSARWVRYMGHGNTANLWNSVTELSVFGQ